VDDEDLAKIIRGLVDFGQMQASHTAALSAAVYSILKQHPNLEGIANDFMSRMDRYASSVSAERLMEMREPWQLLLNAMTEELNRRKKN
jgi:hypothetical protein